MPEIAVTHAADSDDSAGLGLQTVAEAYLVGLRAQGIRHLFLNAGTDFAPLVEAYGRLGRHNAVAVPEPVIAAHENLAIGMAHGAYLMSGMPQAVMVHVGVGTANAVCGLMNAARDRIPILLSAGRTPVFEKGPLGARDTRIQWGQEMFDQAGLVRESVKWDYELRDGRQTEAVVARALSIAATEPKGPVYLTLPREVLAAPFVTQPPRRQPALPTAPAPDAAAIARLAEALASAAFPVIVAMASGADPTTVAPLVRLCERFAIGYAEDQARYLNFPAGHPLHLGYQIALVLQESDALCLLECDVPWIPNVCEPRPGSFIAQCGVDPGFGRYPMRSLACDLAITGTAGATIEALEQALIARLGQIDPDRRGRIERYAAALRAERDKTVAGGLSGPITRDKVAAALGTVLSPDTVVFNEYWAPPEALKRTRPQSYYFLPPAGGLGWGLPAALGAKLLAPQRTVVALIGDGTYLFSNPAACHHAATRHRLAVLTVVYNNACWGAVENATRNVYPQGHWLGAQAPSLSDLAPMPALEKYVEASGGYGECVTTAEALIPALRRALHEVEANNRQAVLNIIGT